MLNSLRKIFASTGSYHRRWQRILMSEPVTVTVGDNPPRNALLDEISDGGARLTIAVRPQPGSVIAIDFATSPGRRHTVRARVVRVAKEERGYNWHCGVSFIVADARELRQIADFVEQERKRRKTGFAMPRA